MVEEQPVMQTPVPAPAQPPPAVKLKPSRLPVLIVAVILIGFGFGLVGFYFGVQQTLNKNQPTNPTPPTFPPNQVACTLEAKLCPDGSSVGRSGPNCEFAPCPTTSYTPVEVKNIADFFSEKFPTRATVYLQENSFLSDTAVTALTCSSYSSGYAGFEQSQLYFDESRGYDAFRANPQTNALKDQELLDFIAAFNQNLQKQNPQQRIRDIGKCTAANGTTIVGYTLLLANTPEHEQTANYYGVLQNGQLTNTVSIPKNDGLFSCRTNPFLYTSDGTAFIQCGIGDAGTAIVWIYRLNFNMAQATEVLKCSAVSELGENTPEPEYSCEKPLR